MEGISEYNSDSDWLKTDKHDCTSHLLNRNQSCIERSCIWLKRELGCANCKRSVDRNQYFITNCMNMEVFSLVCLFFFSFLFLWTAILKIMHLSILSLGGGAGKCGTFVFLEEFLIKTPHPGVKNMVQIRSNLPTLETNCIEYQNIWPCICEFYYTLGTLKCHLCLKYVVRSCLL